MRKVLIASKNAGKVAEFKKMLLPYGYEVVSLLEFPDAPDVDETGKTFQENALLKSETIAQKYDCIAIADDSGLVVDALDGRPGIYSARYAGLEKDDQKNIEKVLDELCDIPVSERTAHFICVLAVSGPGLPSFTVEGECHGFITKEPHGDGGFGYDPIFFVPDKGKTFAELSANEKNEISHRALALKKLEKRMDELTSKQN